jgi:hypothetical protein
MPRKKKLDEVVPPAPLEAPVEKKSAARRGKKLPEPVPEPSVEPTAAKPARPRAKKSAPEPASQEGVLFEVVPEAPKRRKIGDTGKPKAERAPIKAVKAEAPAPEPSASEAPKKSASPARPKIGQKTPAESPVSDSTPAPEAPKRNPRGRAKTETKVEAALDVDGDDLPIPSWRPLSRPAKSKRPRAEGAKPETPRTGRRERATVPVASEAPAAPAPVRTPPPDFSAEIEDAPIIEWRSLTPKSEAKRPARGSREREPRSGERRPRRGESAPPEIGTDRRAEREPREPRMERAPEPVSAPVPVTAPARDPIAVPDDAPQVVLLDGKPTLVRDHRVYPPLFFFGNPSDERRANTVFEEMRMAADAGIHLHAHLIELEVNEGAVEQAVAFAGFLLKKSVEVDPEAQVLFRIMFVAPYGWQERFPDGRFRSSNEPSVCDDNLWGVAESCLSQFVRQMRMLDRKDHILGVHLDRGEWFLPGEAEYDDSRAARNKFRDWARTRYLNDEVTLRASWFDGSVRFDNIAVPHHQPEGEEGEKFVRSSRKQRKYVDYHLFLSDATVQRIGDLAYAAKAASDGYFLVGASYGYTFEWSHPSSGHLSLGKLLRTAEVDFIAGPPSYRTREPGGSASFPGPIDSFALNGKLYISEEDFKTSLAVGHEPDDFNPPLRTPQALENVHWRGAGASLAHAAGAAWMDLWGNGWLKTPSVWERASRVRSALIQRMEAPLTDPDVAIFIDERALAYLVDPHAFQLLVQNVRESVLRAGVNAAFYLLSDLAHREHFPESKLYIFLNAWDIRPDLRAAIKSRLQRDNKVLFWLYSAGLFDAGRDSLERAREVTGIALKPQPFHSKSGTTILNRRHALSEAFPDKTLYSNTQLEPSYFAIPEGATVLGEYTQTGLPSFVVKDFKEGAPDLHWTSVFLGEPQVNPALIRALASMAGVHVWNFQDDVVHVRPPFCTVHCTGPGMRTIALPAKFTAYNLLTGEWSYEPHNIRFGAPDGSTHSLLVGPREELQHLLDFNPETRLRIDKLPPRDLNVLQDASAFDVPIMKLHEWMEGDDTDNVADEWFLRPPQMQEEPEQATSSDEGRRRRKRRNPNDRREGRPSGNPPVLQEFDEEIGLSVMFRKRE